MNNDDNITYGCTCEGLPAPGTMCRYVKASNKALCGYRGPWHCDFRVEGCQECGAKTKEEAETKCICSGDKDDCHGCKLWPEP